MELVGPLEVIRFRAQPLVLLNVYAFHLARAIIASSKGGLLESSCLESARQHRPPSPEPRNEEQVLVPDWSQLEDRQMNTVTRPECG